MSLGDLPTGAIDPVIQWVEENVLTQELKSRSNGFVQLSEIIIPGELQLLKHPALPAMQPTVKALKAVIGDLLGEPVLAMKLHLNTLTSDSVILPHGDDFLFHSLSLRAHVPLSTSYGSLGVNFHPDTLDPMVWRMAHVGRMYLLNNFEPHTVMKLDPGTRTHLIIDFIPKRINVGLTAKELIGLIHGVNSTTPLTSDNLVTHSAGNLLTRQRLFEKFSMKEKHQYVTFEEELCEQHYADTREWLRELLTTTKAAVF